MFPTDLDKEVLSGLEVHHVNVEVVVLCLGQELAKLKDLSRSWQQGRVLDMPEKELRRSLFEKRVKLWLMNEYTLKGRDNWPPVSNSSHIPENDDKMHEVLAYLKGIDSFIQKEACPRR